MKLENTIDRMCIPFRDVLDMLEPEHQALTRHVPLAVDNSLVDGYNRLRPISILAYGKQPSAITRGLATAINTPKSQEIFHHTDHLTIAQINDHWIHRLHFWKMAQSSRLALTYDAKVTSPRRVPVSIIGQRFYESLAAGCVLVGKKPITNEMDDLLNWPNCLIELPNSLPDAIELIRDLSADDNKLNLIRERNLAEVQTRHDWRHRIPLMLSL
jgi:hypothetical protein